MDNGIQQAKGKVWVYKYGLMVANMKASGYVIRLILSVGLSIALEIVTQANGNSIKPMEQAHFISQMAESIQANGRMIYSMDLVLKFGMIQVSMRVGMKMDIGIYLEHFNLLTEANMLESLIRIRFMEKAYFNGKMERDLMGFGHKIR